MGDTAVRELVYPVHLFGRQRQRRRVEPHVAVIVTLHQRASVARVGLEMQHPGGMGVQDGIIANTLERGLGTGASAALV